MNSLRDSLEQIQIRITEKQLTQQIHAGLWLEKYIFNQSKENSEVHKNHIESVSKLAEPDAYVHFYEQWKNQLHLCDAQTRIAHAQSRLVIGLGSESILETSIALHHIYGMPYIPGSALKGLAANYVHHYLGADWQEGSTAYTVLFGNNDESGYVTFFDALYQPGSGHNKQALHPDTITAHHPNYYQKGNEAPADWDSPTPIPFLTSTGNYLIALSAPDLKRADMWLTMAFNILTGALQTMGIGAKTSSGYGRMSLSETEEATNTTWRAKSAANRNLQEEIERIPKLRVNQGIHNYYKHWVLITDPDDKILIATTIIDKIKAEGYEQSKSKKDWYKELVNYIESQKMTTTRDILSRIWHELRQASVKDDFAIVEYIAALLIEFSEEQGRPWAFEEQHRPQKKEIRNNIEDDYLKNLLVRAAEQINKTDKEKGIAELFNRHVLFYSSRVQERDGYPTPRNIVSFICNILEIKNDHDFADFSCGSGGFLVARHMEQISSKKAKAGRTVGVELSPNWTNLAYTNLFLHNINPNTIEIHTGDMFRLHEYTDTLKQNSYDRITISPPLDKQVISNFAYTLFPEEANISRRGSGQLSSDTLFAYLLYTKLKSDGRGAVLVSRNTLTAERRNTREIRKTFAEHGEVQAVIELPKNRLILYEQKSAYVLLINKTTQNKTWFFQQGDWNNTEDGLAFLEGALRYTENEEMSQKQVYTGLFSYMNILSRNKYLGIVIQAEMGGEWHIQSKETKLEITIGSQTRSILLPIEPDKTLSPTRVDIEVKPYQILAITNSIRVIGVTISTDEIITHNYDLDPETYLEFRQMVHTTATNTSANTSHAEVNASILEPSEQITKATQVKQVNTLPRLTNVPDVIEIFDKKQQEIWTYIKQNYTTQKYALHFSAHEIPEIFTEQEIAGTLNILERMGLLVQVHLEEPCYRCVTKQDIYKVE